MNTKLLMLTVAAGILSVGSAMAEVKEPDAYLRLTAIERFSPAQAPQLQNGQYNLSSSESRYREKLPVQLGGAIRRVGRSDYRAPRNDSRY